MRGELKLCCLRFIKRFVNIIEFSKIGANFRELGAACKETLVLKWQYPAPNSKHRIAKISILIVLIIKAGLRLNRGDPMLVWKANTTN